MPTFEDIGVRGYLTRSPGTGGRLRREIEGFVVREIPGHIPPGDEYLVVRVRLRNWETARFARALARALGISVHRISYSGLKDKRAITEQYFSIRGVEEERLRKLNLKDVEVLEVLRSSSPLRPGSHIGNEFMITVYDAENPDALDAVLDELLSCGHFPNFYGPQRFGTTRPVNHIVGKQLLLGDYREAVRVFVGFPGEDDSREARLHYWEDEDVKATLYALPKWCGLERTVLQHLLANPGDYRGAMLSLPRNLILMFVHAYQSYLFNLAVSERMARGASLLMPDVGDVVVPVDEHGVPRSDEFVEVTRWNVEKIRALAREGRVYPTGALPGPDAPRAFGLQGEIEREVMEKHGVPQRPLPGVMPGGTRRPVGARWLNSPSIVERGEAKYTLRLALWRGSYATSFMREVMKERSLLMY